MSLGRPIMECRVKSQLRGVVRTNQRFIFGQRHYGISSQERRHPAGGVVRQPRFWLWIGHAGGAPALPGGKIHFPALLLAAISHATESLAPLQIAALSGTARFMMGASQFTT